MIQIPKSFQFTYCGHDHFGKIMVREEKFNKSDIFMI